jgi:hypothetical protein
MKKPVDIFTGFFLTIIFYLLVKSAFGYRK